MELDLIKGIREFMEGVEKWLNKGIRKSGQLDLLKETIDFIYRKLLEW